MADRPLSIDVRRPLVLKKNDLVLLTREDGAIPANIAGFGLFYRDTCYLGSYTLRLHGAEPLCLAASDADGIAAQIGLSNLRMQTANGHEIPDHQLYLGRTLLLLDDDPTFIDTLVFRNSGTSSATFPASLDLGATFESMFVLRGTPAGRRGRLLSPDWDGNVLRFAYEGADGVRRTLLVNFSLPALVAPCTTERTTAHFSLDLQPQESRDLIVVFHVDERPLAAPQPSDAPGSYRVDVVQSARAAAAAALPRDYARLESPSDGLAGVVARSLADLALLEVRRGDHHFTAAGVPWFVGLFGRDSLLPTIQCLPFNPDLGARTTRALAHWQGRRDDPRTREEPGKILHELRVGEMAHLGEVPQTPSYAAVDATLLFLIAVARNAEWSGSLDLLHTLRPNIDSALEWLAHKEAGSARGYVEYEGTTEQGQPQNQSWRDSGTGVLRADGSYPEPPLALVEVQGYAFQARKLIARLLRHNKEELEAVRLEGAAEAMRARFNRDFWMEAEGCYCLALERDGRQVASITSNAAQVLWTGIADAAKATRTAARIMQEDMFSGWGIRTLSTRHPRFDPLAYQQGSVWPFDNALIVSGLRRYGADAAAARIVSAMLDAARGFHLSRLPEFMAGTLRQGGDAPTHTPRADPLQAWSAAAVPFMLTELLGLRANGFARRLRIHRPMLPDGVNEIALRDLRVAGAVVSLRFRRQGDAVRVELLSLDGVLDVPDAWSNEA